MNAAYLEHGPAAQALTKRAIIFPNHSAHISQKPSQPMQVNSSFNVDYNKSKNLLLYMKFKRNNLIVKQIGSQEKGHIQPRGKPPFALCHCLSACFFTEHCVSTQERGGEHTQNQQCKTEIFALGRKALAACKRRADLQQTMGFLGAPVCLLFPGRKAFLKQSIKDWQLVKMNYPIRAPAHLGLDMPPLFNHFHKLLTASSVSLQGSGSQARADLGTVPGEMKLQIRAA